MGSDQRTPTQVVQAALDAFSASDWPKLASLVHPEALDAFRTQQLGSAVGWTIVRRDPKARRRNIAIRPADFITAEAIGRAKNLRVTEFPGRPSVGALAALTPTHFLIRWCAAAFRKRAHNPWAGTQPIQRDIIGEIIENEALAHVLYRKQVRTIELAGALQIMSLRQVAAEWLILLNADIIWNFPLVWPRS